MNELSMNVIGARLYSFTDDRSGRLVQGVNVFHLVEATNAETIGQVPAKITLPIETWDYISKLTFPSTCVPITEQLFTTKGIVTKFTGIKQVALTK